jgi:hypothetical protein
MIHKLAKNKLFQKILSEEINKIINVKSNPKQQTTSNQKRKK